MGKRLVRKVGVRLGLAICAPALVCLVVTGAVGQDARHHVVLQADPAGMHTAKGIPIANPTVGSNGGFAGAQGFYFRAVEDDAGFVSIEDMVVPAGFWI